LACILTTKELNQFLIENFDIITFHNYSPKEKMKEQIAELKQYGYPLLCSEWMNRPSKSTIEDILPLLKEENVSAIL
jgi:hypothetical protein